MEGMKKQDVLELFGGAVKVAEAYGCTRQAVYQWPEDLPASIELRVLGAALRAGKDVSRYTGEP